MSGVFLWQFDLDKVRIPSCLSPDEEARAARFKFDRDRRRYINGRSALRTILGERLNQSPNSLQFEYGPAGKPTLANIFFNLAHSGARALLGITEDTRIGVDIEEARPLDDLEDVAKNVFSPDELQRWQNLTDAEKVAAFYRLWTRKEAYLKAIGEGIAHRLQKFDVTFEQDETPRILQGAEGKWTLADVTTSDLYPAAIAVESPNLIIQRMTLSAG
jgi:4'-phosphopantetheinyl transferase